MQIPENHFNIICSLYHEYVKFLPGNNRISKDAAEAILRLIYEGRRLRDIMRRVHGSKVTIGAVRKYLWRVLDGAEVKLCWPQCACGLGLWHRGVCKVWDDYHPRAIKRGHETQSRLAQMREESPVLLMSHAAGQYAKMKQRDRLREEMAVFVSSNPSTDRSTVISRFMGRGYSRNWGFYRVGNEILEVTRPPDCNAKNADIFFQTIEQTKLMSTILSPPTEATEIEQFTSLIQQGIDAWTQAGKLLVEMLAKDPNAKQSIMEYCPDITEEILSRFEAIGRGQLHPKTLLNNSPGMRRLRMLPYSDQQRFLTEPVEVLVQRESGVDTLKVSVKDLTPRQAQQVISPNGVRSLSAQRAWIESRKSHSAPSAKTPYQIRGGKVIFRADCEMNARELAQILAQLS